ncbi:hypothetical protein F5Y19DRAFT_161886 [Xylariaceae sp. FL1651]|nr:hypothetical protein F5Y19DRAFT_161886 [Xylariaceae sp. FL1651]
MPPRLPAQSRLHGRSTAIFRGLTRSERRSACFFCSLSLDTNQQRAVRRAKRKAPVTRRFETTITTPPIDAEFDTRKELESALLDLQKHAANYINLSRLQLALNGLRQKPGHESIRVALLGLTNGSDSSKTVKEVLRLLLADPLKDPETWEQEVRQHDLAQPMIVRIGAEDPAANSTIVSTRGNLFHEVHVSSTALNSHSLKILLANTNPFLPAPDNVAIDGFEDAVLVPTVDIPTSDTGRYTPITTPVHKALIVTDGILGAASVVSMPTSEDSNVLKYAVNIPEYKPAETNSLPFTPIDTNTASTGLELIRKNLGNAIEFEHLWFQSNIPKLVEWFKADILTTPDGITKPPVRKLIASLLRNTSAAVQAEEARRLGSSTSPTTSHSSSSTLRKELEDWAESAHSELQEQLDLAFSSKRWRKLGWWKLFWRVDDVGMLSNDILTQRFLPRADRSSIFLAGQMKEAGVSFGPIQNSPESDTSVVAFDQSSTVVSKLDSDAASTGTNKWPTNIPAARAYLQMETVPALQALAQKLVLQTLTTSGLTTALGALVYIGTLTTTLYEAGAVATLGIVWSMKRMQKQWETARKFWEGEVREEGRKAVRGVEESMGSALAQRDIQNQERSVTDTQDDLKKASDLVTRAQKLLVKLK